MSDQSVWQCIDDTQTDMQWILYIDILHYWFLFFYVRSRHRWHDRRRQSAMTLPIELFFDRNWFHKHWGLVFEILADIRDRPEGKIERGILDLCYGGRDLWKYWRARVGLGSAISAHSSGISSGRARRLIHPEASTEGVGGSHGEMVKGRRRWSMGGQCLSYIGGDHNMIMPNEAVRRVPLSFCTL